MELYFSSTQYRHTWEEVVQMLTDVEEHRIAERIQKDKVDSLGKCTELYMIIIV